MCEQISTRRAIEVVLSRVKMHASAARFLFCVLENERRGNPTKPASGDIEAMTVEIMRALDLMSDIDILSRNGQSSRLREIKTILNDVVRSAKGK